MAAVATKQNGEWISESEIAKRVKLHRQTVASRLEDLGYEPDAERSNAKLKVYWFDSEMDLAIRSAKDSISAAKIHGLRLDNEIKQMKLAEARGELVPMHEVVEMSQKLVGAVYKEFSIHQPKRLAARLAKCKTAAEVSKLLKSDTEKFMARLRGNHTELLN
ncbi:MAG TPA: hypothetical protein VJL58_04205 [Pyrinomonadaceae bacterium]|nr:hypothetical protein [Pyrinomonadaceae bacterium]